MKRSLLKDKLRTLRTVAFAARKVWTFPPHADLLLYDQAGIELLHDYVAESRTAVLCCRGEEINVPVLLSVLLRGRFDSAAYIDEFIRRVRPRLLVTFIDNNEKFYGMWRQHPELKTMFIQNGYRGFYNDVFESLSRQAGTLEKYRVDYMLTFGTAMGSQYARYIAGKAIPVGSIINNHLGITVRENPGLLVFISQFKPQGLQVGPEYFSREEFNIAPDRIIVRALVRYAKKRQKRFMIVPRATSEAARIREQEYFDDLAGERVELTTNEKFGDSYRAVDSAEVVVSNTSTLGLEAAARGKKTAFFTIHKHIYESRKGLIWDRGVVWPDVYPGDGPFWTHRPEEAAFERILDYLFSIDNTEWRALLEQHDFQQAMDYDPGNTILRQVLEEAVGSGQPSHFGSPNGSGPVRTTRSAAPSHA